MADGGYSQAINIFGQGIKFTKQADAAVDELLNHGYIPVVRRLESPKDNRVLENYEGLNIAFQGVEHGEDFIELLNTAHAVFSRYTQIETKLSGYKPNVIQ